MSCKAKVGEKSADKAEFFSENHAGPAVKNFLAPLHQPAFRSLAGAYTVNELGNWLGEIALAVLVFKETGSPLATAALFLGMQFIPGLLGQFVVAKSEMARTRRILPLLYLAEGATFVFLALLVDNFVLALVVVLAAVDGTLAIASRALTRAAAAAVLKPAGQLRQGNALINIGFTGAGAIGPALAGVVVAGFGVKTALLLDAASFGVVAAVLFLASSIPEVSSEAQPWRDRLRDGLNYVRARTVLLRLLVVQAAAFVFFASVIPIEIVYANDSLNAGSSGYGALLASWGLGMVAGSLMFAAARKVSLRLLIIIGTAAVGVAYLGMAGATSLGVACIAAGIGGIGNGVLWVSIVSAVQELTAHEYQARVVGLLESIGSAMPGIGFVLGGLMTELVNPRASFLLAGIGVVLVAIIAAVTLRAAWTPDDGVEIPAEQIHQIAMATPINVTSLP